MRIGLRHAERADEATNCKAAGRSAIIRDADLQIRLSCELHGMI